MSFENLKLEWNKKIEKSIENIESMISDEDIDNIGESEFKSFARWLINNNHSGYEYLSGGWENFKSNPLETEALLQNIHHAMLDDGEMSFVTMKIDGDVKRIFIAFVYENDEYFRNYCLKENNQLIQSFINGRKSQISLAQKMNKLYPEKEFKIKGELTLDKITFEAHQNAKLFIEEFEKYQGYVELKNQEIDKKLSSIRKSKP